MPNGDTRVAVPTGERQYHIGLGPGELADYILLPGDQDRVERVASRFDSVERTHRHREFASATGLYRGVRVSCVRPGGVFTEINQRAGLFDDATALARLESLAPAHALGRLGTVEEIAEAVEYLARAEWTTGNVLTVDGGLGLGVTNA